MIDGHHLLHIEQTIVLQVTVHNFTLINEVLTGTQVCADQASLLALLELIPALIPFRPLIHALIVVRALISLLVLCIYLNPPLSVMLLGVEGYSRASVQRLRTHRRLERHVYGGIWLRVPQHHPHVLGRQGKRNGRVSRDDSLLKPPVSSYFVDF